MPETTRQVLEVDLGFDQRAGEAVDGGADAAAGHQMCGMRSMRRNGSTGLRSVNGIHEQLSSRRLLMAFRISSGLCTLPPACGTRMVLALPPAARSTSRTICPRLSSGTTKALALGGHFADLLFRERPGGDEAELADLHALVAGHVDGALGHARGDAVADHHHVGALESRLLRTGRSRRRCR